MATMKHLHTMKQMRAFIKGMQSSVCGKIIEAGNKAICMLPFKALTAMPIEIPNEQRLLDVDKVRAIVKYQKNYYKTAQRFNFMGAINIHMYDKKYYLIDGQHRFHAIKKLIGKGAGKASASAGKGKEPAEDNDSDTASSDGNHATDVVCVEFVCVDSYQEMARNYDMINMNTGLPEFPEEIKKSVPEAVAKFFFEKYPTHWSSASKPQRPNFNKNQFQEAIGYLTLELGKRMTAEPDSGVVQKYMEDYNATLAAKSVEDLRRLSPRIKSDSPFYKKCRETGFFLGIFQLTAKEYVYKWTLEILRPLGTRRNSSARKSKSKIPRPLRDACWDKYVGRTLGEAPCFCCRTNKIKMRSFHCGHVLAEANGGKIVVENLRPICATCNSEMGTMHMREFIEKYYESNLATFDRSVL